MTITEDPMLISIMKRDPTGEVVHKPEGKPKIGTSTRGFLEEYQEALAAVWAEGYSAGRNFEFNDRQPLTKDNPYSPEPPT